MKYGDILINKIKIRNWKFRKGEIWQHYLKIKKKNEKTKKKTGENAQEKRMENIYSVGFNGANHLN